MQEKSVAISHGYESLMISQNHERSISDSVSDDHQNGVAMACYCNCGCACHVTG